MSQNLPLHRPKRGAHRSFAHNPTYVLTESELLVHLSSRGVILAAGARFLGKLGRHKTGMISPMNSFDHSPFPSTPIPGPTFSKSTRHHLNHYRGRGSAQFALFGLHAARRPLLLRV